MLSVFLYFCASSHWLILRFDDFQFLHYLWTVTRKIFLYICILCPVIDHHMNFQDFLKEFIVISFRCDTNVPQGGDSNFSRK